MAEKNQIIDAIEALAVHCRPPLMSVEDKTRWMRDWADDLAQFPLEAITNGTRKWRHSGATKFPTAGQLLPLIRETVPQDHGEKLHAWRPASQEEYAQMSVREKIREHLILANAEGIKAGPMFVNTTGGGPMSRASGRHLTPEEMPPSWRIHRGAEMNHYAEVKRLRELISGEYRGVA